MADPPESEIAALLQLLATGGLTPASPAAAAPRLPDHVPVTLDGAVLGYIAAARAPALAAKLRTSKAQALADTARGVPPRASAVPMHTEVAYLPFERGGPYPGLCIYTQQARMARVVRQVGSGKEELIGSLEQSNMHIRRAEPLPCS